MIRYRKTTLKERCRAAVRAFQDFSMIAETETLIKTAPREIQKVAIGLEIKDCSAEDAKYWREKLAREIGLALLRDGLLDIKTRRVECNNKLCGVEHCFVQYSASVEVLQSRNKEANA